MRVKIHSFFIAFILAVVAAGVLKAEPLLLDQPTNVVEKGQAEVGLFNSFEQDQWRFFGAADTKYTLTRFTIPLSVRYGLSERLEARVLVPYVSWKLEQKRAGTTTDSSEGGIGDVSASVKYNFVKGETGRLGALLSVTAPTGDEDNGLGEGTDAGLSLLYARDLGPLIGYVNTGYNFTFAYKLKTTAGEVEVDPGDQVTYGIGLEWPQKWWEGFSLIGEAGGNAFSNAKVAKTEVQESNGSTLDLTIGGRYNTGRLKTLLGAAFAVGDETDRTHDYNVLLGVAWLF